MSSYPIIAGISGIALLTVSLLFQTYAPNSIGYPTTSSLLSAGSWSPQLAGMAIGLLQLPALLFMKEPLGASSSLSAVLSPFFWILEQVGIVSHENEVVQLRSTFFKKLLYVIGMISGGLVSALIGDTYGVPTGLNSDAPTPFVSSLFGSGLAQAFVGGFLLWLGARIQGGCTSGHGISGFTMLKKMSILAVPAMFGGGILTMHLLKYVFN
jgi:uncharacterized membrane protein YedE/YeeE